MFLNTDVAVKIVIRVPNKLPTSILAYFLAEEIVTYFAVKKCS